MKKSVQPKGHLHTVKSLERRFMLLKWIAPLALTVSVLVLEGIEHFGIASNHPVNPLRHFVMEVIIFGIVLSITIGSLIRWLERAVFQQNDMLKDVVQAQDSIRGLNAELESRVAERTKELEAIRDLLERQNKDLTALDNVKSGFVSLVSHELRAPLTNINGGIELLLHREKDLSRRARKTLTTLSNESERLTRLVETILNISALEAGKLSLSLEGLCVKEIIHAQVQVCSGKHESERVRIILPDTLPPVIADRNCVSTVMANLLDNAYKYARQGEIVVQACHEGQAVHVTVADEGHGVPEHEQAHIFEMFYRVDGSDDREIYGYGVGLYAARQLVEAMDGKIWVKSKPHHGAEFHFTLPVASG